MDARPGRGHAPTAPVRQLDRPPEGAFGELGPPGQRCEPSERQSERSVAAGRAQLRRLVDVRLELGGGPVDQFVQRQVRDDLGLEECITTARVPLPDSDDLGPGERRLGTLGVAERCSCDRDPPRIG